MNKDKVYKMMQTALLRALAEIHNPGANRAEGFDITGRIDEVLKLAKIHQPN